MEDLQKMTENTGNISITKKKKKKMKKTKDLKLQASIKDKDDMKETVEQENEIKSNDGSKNKKKKERKRKANEELKDNDKPERTNSQQKSKKKKKKKSKSTKETAEDETVESKAQQLAVQYLQQWKHFRNIWSFQKVRQVWLLRNMYDVDMVDDEVFEVLLEYLEPLKGLAKTTTLQKAEQLLKDQEESDGSDSGQDDKPTQEKEDIQKRAKLTDKQLDRVRQVMQILV